MKSFAYSVCERFNFLHLETDFKMKPETENLILIQIIRKSIKQSVVVNILEIPIILLTYHILLSANPSIYVNIWLFWHLVVSNLLRGTFIYLYHRKHRIEDGQFWRRIYGCMALLTGSSWGVVGSILMPFNAPEVQLYIVLVIFALASGAMPVLAPLLREYSIFLLSLMVPFTLRMVIQGGTTSVFGILLPCWITLTLVAAYHTRNLLIKALYLQHESKGLYDETVKAKVDLERINNNLIFEIRLRKAAEKRLESIATHDTLTGLPNRGMLHNFLNDAQAKADVMNKIIAIVFLDLDNFKPINDNFGHDVGDKLLAAIGERLRYRIRKSDFVCRVGGDEFVVVITHLEDPTHIPHIVENILQALSEQYTLEKDLSISLSASAGVSIYPYDSRKHDQLIKFADIAMYQAKEQGGNTFRFYKSDKTL